MARRPSYPYRISYQDGQTQQQRDCDPGFLLTTGEAVEVELDCWVTIVEIIRHPTPEGPAGEARGRRQRWR